MKVLMLHGINLNLLGKCDKSRYGSVTLAQIDASLRRLAKELDVDVTSFQTNSEGAMCERIDQGIAEQVDAVLINAGAWTHRSYCIRDALANLRVPVVELQMPNIHARETLKQPSLLAQVVKGQILGFGVDSYLLGLRAVVQAARSRHRSAGAHHRNTSSLSKLRARPLSGSTKRSP